VVDTRVGDAHALHLEVLGVEMTLRICNPTDEGLADLAEVVAEAWSRCVRAAVTEPQVTLDVLIEPGASLTVTDEEVRGPDREVVLEALTSLVTRRAIDQQAGRLLMLHAAAVAAPGGGAVVLIGPSGAGKTTLAVTLGQAFGYLTDETTVVTDDLHVLGYPKPLSVLPAEGPPKRQVSPDTLGLLTPGPGPHPLRAVLLLDRSSDHVGPATLEAVTTVDALPEIAAQTSYSAQLERPLHRLADLARAVGGVQRVTYAEAADVIPVVSRLLVGTAS
jgi:hypothetical protein